MNDGDGGSDSQGTPIEQARAAAKILIDQAMMQGMLRTYQQLLDEVESGELHYFSSVIDWGVKIIGEVPLLDSFAISHATLKRWIEGTFTPGPMGRAAILERLRILVRNRTK